MIMVNGAITHGWVIFYNTSLVFCAEETEEHADLSKALAQIREVIAAVDLSVSEYERHQRFQEVWSRVENRSVAKLKNGYTFRKQDMMGPGQTLKHQGVLLWKTATGRLKGETRCLVCFCLIDKSAILTRFSCMSSPLQMSWRCFSQIHSSSCKRKIRNTHLLPWYATRLKPASVSVVDGVLSITSVIYPLVSHLPAGPEASGDCPAEVDRTRGRQ